MAGSRVENVGTIFSRITGMIRAGGIKWNDRPLWYDVYAAFPPKSEPRLDRAVPKDSTVRQLLYPEDEVRAQFYKTYGSPSLMNLTEEGTPAISERFLKKYIDLAKSDPNKGPDELFMATTNALESEGVVLRKKGPAGRPSSAKNSEKVQEPEAKT